MIEITKSFKKHLVLDHVSLSIEPNKIYLIIGHNGAGKTTLFKTLAGLYRQFDGKIEKSKYVLVEDVPAFDRSRTGRESLRYHLSSKEYERAESLITSFAMDEYIDLPYRTYSQGMCKKLALVLGMSKDFDVLLLDEPTNALDRDAMDTLKALLNSFRESGTVIISSHDASLIDPKLVDCILTLQNKKIQTYDSITTRFNYYYATTERAMPSHDAFIEKVIAHNTYILKVTPGEETKCSSHVSEYGLLEFRHVNYTDSLSHKDMS